MKKSQFESLIREVIRETIRKVDGKYVVYPEKGGKRLGTHSTKAAAEKQLTAIHLNKVAEVKQEATDSMALIFDRNENDLFLYDTTAKQILGYINVYGNSVTGVAAKKGYGPLMYELGMAHVYPNALQSDRNGNTEPEAKAVWEKFIAGANPKIKVVKLSPSDKEYRTKYPNGYEIWDSDQFYNYKFYNPDTSTLRKLTSNGNSLSLEEKNEIIKLGNDFYHSLVSESSKVKENFADGKVKGKSRPGRVKKAGASCKGSVTDLRAKAKKYGGEKGKMYHWCANMKSGRK